MTVATSLFHLDNGNIERVLEIYDKQLRTNASQPGSDMGLPFCLALQDFAAGKYADCVKRLMPLRYTTHRLGGSFAQRDIIGWTLLEASLRARQFSLGLSLANERCSLKPTSGQNWTYVARAHKGLANFERARYAEAQANALLVA